METFLKIVADDLYNRTKGELNRTAVIFPNKRASLFFSEYLAQASDKPVWVPAYLTISQLFRSQSTLEVADNIQLVCELYKVYKEVTQSNETLDDFYFWGEMLINDFDDADKNKVDTMLMFNNLKNLKDMMSDLSFMDEEQEEAIRQFFRNFSIEKRTALKEKFISMWDVLGDIYTQFKNSLKQKQLAYEGMLYREVMENFDATNTAFDQYVFVGFNVLNKVEKELFIKLKDEGKAIFYWDYDEYYMGKNHHEAGEFIKQNIKDFPSALDGRIPFDNMSRLKDINYISTPTENAQARFLPQWIRENITEIERETAIVLCNESLLQPVLHSIPQEVKHINITMGYPLSQTPVYSLITSLLDLQIEGYNYNTGRYVYEKVLAVLKHPYTRMLSKNVNSLIDELTNNNRFYPLPSEMKADEQLSTVFTPKDDNLSIVSYLLEVLELVTNIYRDEPEEKKKDVFNQLYRESLFKAYTTINRFYTLIESKDLTVKKEMLRKLIIKVLSATNIPFHGEPAIGMQVMGVLETRNLDFKHLILLSANEGQLPKTGGDASFIPHNLRKAFGMTTIEHQISVYAYYFYRLIQRAEKVTLMYNNSAEGLNKGEWSRFMLQLLVEYNHPITLQTLQAGQTPQSGDSITIPKTEQVMQKMHRRYNISYNPKALLSPSALNTYMDCPLKFYFKYVAGLKLPDEVSSEIDSAMFGSIFHLSAENLLHDLANHEKMVTKEAIESVLKSDTLRIEKYVDNAFKELFFHTESNEKPEYNGTQLVNSAVIARYLKQLLKLDYNYAPFKLVGTETNITETVDIHTSSGNFQTNIGGIIDRMDSKDGILRVVDYKTGGKKENQQTMESLFVSKNRSSYIFQTFLYSSIVCRKVENKVAPTLLYIQRASTDDYDPIVSIKEGKEKYTIYDFKEYADDFRNRLDELLSEVFNPDIPFTQTMHEEKCLYCDFKSFCKK